MRPDRVKNPAKALGMNGEDQQRMVTNATAAPCVSGNSTSASNAKSMTKNEQRVIYHAGHCCRQRRTWEEFTGEREETLSAAH